MHPLLATMFANAHAEELRCAADARRRDRSSRPQARRITLRRPRRTARVAHA